MAGWARLRVIHVPVFSSAVLLALLVLPSSAGAAPPAVPETAGWVQNHRATTVWAGAEDGRALAPAGQWTRFRVAGPQVKMRVPVVDDRLGAAGWVDALDVGPVGPPPAQVVVAPEPPAAPPASPAATLAPRGPAPVAAAPAVPPSLAPATPAVVPATTLSPPVAPGPAPSVVAPPAPAPMGAERWLQSHHPATLWAGPEGAAAVRALPQWTYFRVSGPSVGARLPVFEPISESDGWVDAADVGPAGPPPPPAPPAPPAPPIVDPPPDQRGVGLASRQVAPPRPRAVGGAERWIDVDLSAQRLRLMEGDQVVRVVPVTTGKAGFRTPTGTFRIFHRVESDVMDSATLGVDRGSAEGYLLKNVKYTQYFADGGYALHANYWQPPSIFGQAPTSHGCVGMAEGDAAAVWSFAGHGTVVHIH